MHLLRTSLLILQISFLTGALASTALQDFSYRRNDSTGDFKLSRSLTTNSISDDDAQTQSFHCETSVQPPEKSLIETYEINLDLPPEQRWTALVNRKKAEIIALIDHVIRYTSAILGPAIPRIESLASRIVKTLPSAYRGEIEGISNAMQVEFKKIAFYNLFYEFSPACTSIVMQSENGTIYLGRNLDFGNFLGWNFRNHTWVTTELLRSLVVQLEFIREGKVVYRSIGYAGYIGCVTAVKKDQFALAINERRSLNGGPVGILEWLLGFKKQSWLAQITRQVMDTCQSYSCAQKMLSKPVLVAPSYFILTGTNSNEGCIITRGRNSSTITALGALRKHQNESWYLVQTNTDQWKKPPFYDDRDTPSMACVEKLGREDVLHTLTNVLATKPVLNKANTYTAVMSAPLDLLIAWIPNHF